MKRILHLFFIITASFTFCFSQIEGDSADIIKADAGACELNSVFFDAIRIEASNNRERVFAIFRAGKGETENVNARRLAHVKAFLEQAKNWKALDVVYARGEKTDSEGRIEFYLNGKLFFVALAQKNKTPCLDCCDGGITSPTNLVKKKKRKVKNYKK